MSLFTGATLLGMGLAGGLGSAAIQAHQTGKAVDAQTNAANQALALQQQVYNDQKQNAAPYQQLGTSTLGRLGQMAAQPANQFNPANYQGQDSGHGQRCATYVADWEPIPAGRSIGM